MNTIILAAGVATLLNLDTGELETIKHHGNRAYNVDTMEFYNRPRNNKPTSTRKRIGI